MLLSNPWLWITIKQGPIWTKSPILKLFSQTKHWWGGRIERLLDSRKMTSDLTLIRAKTTSISISYKYNWDWICIITACISSIIVPFPDDCLDPYFTNNTGFQGDCPDNCPNWEDTSKIRTYRCKKTDMRKDVNLWASEPSSWIYLFLNVDLLNQNSLSWRCGQINLQINHSMKKQTQGPNKSNSSF